MDKDIKNMKLIGGQYLIRDQMKVPKTMCSVGTAADHTVVFMSTEYPCSRTVFLVDEILLIKRLLAD